MEDYNDLDFLLAELKSWLAERPYMQTPQVAQQMERLETALMIERPSQSGRRPRNGARPVEGATLISFPGGAATLPLAN
jgi:hypothetical protein